MARSAATASLFSKAVHITRDPDAGSIQIYWGGVRNAAMDIGLNWKVVAGPKSCIVTGVVPFFFEKQTAAFDATYLENRTKLVKLLYALVYQYTSASENKRNKYRRPAPSAILAYVKDNKFAVAKAEEAAAAAAAVVESNAAWEKKVSEWFAAIHGGLVATADLRRPKDVETMVGSKITIGKKDKDNINPFVANDPPKDGIGIVKVGTHVIGSVHSIIKAFEAPRGLPPKGMDTPEDFLRMMFPRVTIKTADKTLVTLALIPAKNIFPAARVPDNIPPSANKKWRKVATWKTADEAIKAIKEADPRSAATIKSGTRIDLCVSASADASKINQDAYWARSVTSSAGSRTRVLREFSGEHNELIDKHKGETLVTVTFADPNATRTSTVVMDKAGTGVTVRLCANTAASYFRPLFNLIVTLSLFRRSGKDLDAIALSSGAKSKVSVTAPRHVRPAQTTYSQPPPPLSSDLLDGY